MAAKVTRGRILDNQRPPLKIDYPIRSWIFPSPWSPPGRSPLGLDEGQQVRVDGVGLRGANAMRKALIGEELGILHQRGGKRP
jgi:hypothetical protein